MGFKLREKTIAMIPRLFLVLFVFLSLSLSANEAELYDLQAIRDVDSLEVNVIEDWRPHPKMPDIQQKLVEIVVAEWWKGQKVRIPVTLNVPTNSEQLPCQNVIVANMPLRVKMATPNGPSLELLREKGVGVVLVGMGTIDGMVPEGQLHLGMEEQLLKTKDPRFSAAWIWGMSQMRGLTAAVAESNYFQPEQVISTGGSKRGIATSIAGIHDDRFTGIMPVVAPPHGNPGRPVAVRGLEPVWIADQNRAFLETVDPGVRNSLLQRTLRRNVGRITLNDSLRHGWSEDDMINLNDRIFDSSRITRHLDSVNERNLLFMYHVGTNDSVTPALLELGELHPQFPLYIVPGGQHGGPADAGYTRRVTIQPEVQSNFDSFCRLHFFGSGGIPEAPNISAERKGNQLIVTSYFKSDVKPESNQLSWSFDRHRPYTFPFEYDPWNSSPMKNEMDGSWSARIPIMSENKSIQLVSTHQVGSGGYPFAISSSLKELRLD